MASYLSREEFMQRYSPDLSKDDDNDDVSLWVFGYGSLMWKPGFDYHSYRVGYIHDLVRVFHQGNDTFRGSKAKPGRVANLEERKGAKQWGIAFEFKGRKEVEESLHRLYDREIDGGNYTVTKTKFHPRSRHSPFNDLILPHSPSTDNKINANIELGRHRENQLYYHTRDHDHIETLVFTVRLDNHLYLGPDDVDKMADQIASTSGSKGSNAEYVIKTAEFCRRYIPEDEDQHMFDLVHHIHDKLKHRVFALSRIAG